MRKGWEREETLRDIFRLLRLGTFSPDKAVDRSPVCAAKILKRLLCCWRFTLRLSSTTLQCVVANAPGLADVRSIVLTEVTSRGQRSHRDYTKKTSRKQAHI